MQHVDVLGFYQDGTSRFSCFGMLVAIPTSQQPEAMQGLSDGRQLGTTRHVHSRVVHLTLVDALPAQHFRSGRCLSSSAQESYEQ